MCNDKNKYNLGIYHALMSTIDILIVVVVAALLIIFILLLDHKLKHAGDYHIQSTPRCSKECREIFQPEDVCVCHCTHENWIVFW